MSKFRFLMLYILIYFCVLIIYVRKLFKPKEHSMPRNMTNDDVAKFMMRVGEDIFEYVPMDEDISLPEGTLVDAFGAFLLKNYPKHKAEIKEAQQNGCVDFFDYRCIEPFADDHGSSGLDLAQKAFVKFCNEQDALRVYMLDLFAEYGIDD